MTNNTRRFKYRFLSRLVIEATSPISIGSGKGDLITGRTIARDIYGLPYIPGTAIAGIIRHAIGEDKANPFFGVSTSEDDDLGYGSQVIFSSAYLLDSKYQVVEGINRELSDIYLSHFNYLPIRQHVRVNSEGTAVDKGKFDNEVVYKGTRFCFEIEMLAESDRQEDYFKAIIRVLFSNLIRLGYGTRVGYGEFEVVDGKIAILDLEIPEHLESYIEKSSSLNDCFWKSKLISNINDMTINNRENSISYKLELESDDFCIFGSGLGNDIANDTPVTESYIEWTADGKPSFRDRAILIPASSIKGALSHRLAYHFNKKKNIYIDDNRAESGVNNLAIRTLFGYTEDSKAVPGCIFISDLIKTLENDEPKKLLNHVAIDRFTGGAIGGALYSEEVIANQKFTLSIYLDTDRFNHNCENENISNDDKKIIMSSFDKTLNDVTTGMLPLGGSVNRGHGCFSGQTIKYMICNE